MKGLELSEGFYWDVLAPLIDKSMPFIKGRYTAGLIGYGSDVLGFDDEISRDHEWGPRAQLWLTQSDYTHYAKRLDRMFRAELPATYSGFYTRYEVDPQIHCLVPSANGDIHHVAISTVSRHLRLQLGLRTSNPDYVDWLCLPEQKLLEFTRGRIFYDPVGEISRVRRTLAYFPEDIWRYKLVYAWESIDSMIDVIFLNALRGDILSARINLNSVISGIIRLVFLLNKRYCPGTPKWISREFYTLPNLAKELGIKLEQIQVISEIHDCKLLLDEVLMSLVQEHNFQKITPQVNLDETGFRQQVQTYSLQPVIKALMKTLPTELQDLEIHGGIDQWITNPDILIWAEQYTKLKHTYQHKSRVRREGIGDKIV